MLDMQNITFLADYYILCDGSSKRQINAVTDELIDTLKKAGSQRAIIEGSAESGWVLVDFGSINTTGMEQIDYRITDNILTTDHIRKFYVEESVCLESGFFTYRPPDKSPMVGPLPVRKNGFVTYGSFNHNCKMNNHILRSYFIR